MRTRLRGLCGGLLAACALSTVAAATTVDVAYIYDTLGRLTQINYPTGYTIKYEYDDAGNRTTVTSTGTNAPVANNDSVSTSQDIAISHYDPKLNDGAYSGFPIAISSLGAAAHGSAVLNTDNTVTYAPGTGYLGADSFGYTISDGHGGSSSATVAVTISVNNPPSAYDDYIIARNLQGSVPATITFDPRINDTDPDNDPITIKSVQNPTSAGGTAQKNSGSSVTYTAPSVGYQGSDTFTYTIKDGQGHNDTATVHVTVQ